LQRIELLKLRVLGRILESGLIAVIRSGNSEEAIRIAEACVEGGATVLELTFTVPGAVDIIQRLSKRDASSSLIVGAGTVLDPETARLAILAGAHFVVSPAMNAETAKLCNRYQIPYLPGAGTVREIIEAMESGADIIKVFPGETTGPAFVKAVKAALPQAALMPTGGVSLENVRSWIKAGCVAVGVGGNITHSAADGDFKSISDTTRRFLEEIRRARS
jgi:2-dehydro-3-deoxyphosphogluconate aldolase / (4S)-4-hydroxy-2-oxoglutarate aldolase